MADNQFSFNFFDEGYREEKDQGCNSDKEANETNRLPAVKLHFEKEALLRQHFSTSPICTAHGIELVIVDQSKCSDVLQIGIDSDLEPGVYEGGLKVWECSLDLVDYLHASEVQFCSGDTVLELGCGHGLPGIYCHRLGAQAIVFSDYNREVLEHITLPNVALNLQADRSLSHCAFYSGDWDSLSTLMQGENECPSAYTWILAAETLYTEETTLKVYHMIHKHLSRPHGVALVSSKRYYFGTGGSTQHFIDLISSDTELSCEKVWISEDGKSNIREILQIMWIQ